MYNPSVVRHTLLWESGCGLFVSQADDLISMYFIYLHNLSYVYKISEHVVYSAKQAALIKNAVSHKSVYFFHFTPYIS